MPDFKAVVSFTVDRSQLGPVIAAGLRGFMRGGPADVVGTPPKSDPEREWIGVAEYPLYEGGAVALKFRCAKFTGTKVLDCKALALGVQRLGQRFPEIFVELYTGEGSILEEELGLYVIQLALFDDIFEMGGAGQ